MLEECARTERHSVQKRAISQEAEETRRCTVAHSGRGAGARPPPGMPPASPASPQPPPGAAPTRRAAPARPRKGRRAKDLSDRWARRPSGSQSLRGRIAASRRVACRCRRGLRTRAWGREGTSRRSRGVPGSASCARIYGQHLYPTVHVSDVFDKHSCASAGRVQLS